ncbi:MAG TPA: cupin [Firmicutes bacterium]|nr:cupin [Bacillota bacterium]
MSDSQYWIDALGLIKHPEGGYFQEKYRCPETVSLNTGTPDQKRNLASSIYFLLPGNEVSAFHRLRYDEIWYYHAGSPLIIYMIDDHGKLTEHKLGLNAGQNEWPQVVVPRGNIFGAIVCQPESYTLIGCVVAPGFDYQDFELLPRKMLLGQYPQYRELILKLTRAEK